MQLGEYIEPRDEQRCTHTYEDGRRCRAYRSRSSTLCAGHAGVSTFTSETARAAQARSVEASRKRRYARRLATLSPRALTADDVLRIEAAERAVELATAMLAPLDDPDLGALTKAKHAAWLQDRARPDIRPDVLAAMTLERAKAQLHAAPDPRRALTSMTDAELAALADADTIDAEAIELTA